MAENEMLTDVPLTQIRDFLHHPYLVKDDESMDELVESIKERGLIQPVIIRPVEDGMYEMVSGHRRKRAFEIAGYEKIPARVKEMSRDEAILSMVDSNLQRETVLPSEKARAYKMRLKKIKSFFKGLCSKTKSAAKSTEAVIKAKVIKLLVGIRAEAYVDTGVKFLIAVVVGALLLGGLYALFNTTIMPTVTQKIQELFNYTA